MIDDEKPSGETEWTEDEQQKLHHEQFIKQVLAARAETKKPDPLILKILNSTGFSAFMTVVVGGLVIQLILSTWQANQKSKEADLERDRQSSQQRYDIVKSSVELISKLTHVTGVFVENTKEGSSIQPYDTSDPDRRMKEIEGLRQNMHTMIEQWRITEGTMGFWMGSAYKDSPDVIEFWNATRKSVNDYLSCVSTIDQKYSVENSRIDPVEYQACETKKLELQDSLKRFGSILN